MINVTRALCTQPSELQAVALYTPDIVRLATAEYGLEDWRTVYHGLFKLSEDRYCGSVVSTPSFIHVITLAGLESTTNGKVVRGCPSVMRIVVVGKSVTIVGGSA